MSEIEEPDHISETVEPPEEERHEVKPEDLEAHTFEVDMPGGGHLHLHSPEEMELWNTLRERYIDDFGLVKVTDQISVGMLLTQQMALYRAQQLSNGRRVKMAEAGPTGEYERVPPEETLAATGQMDKAINQIGKLEERLGIDKKSREAGGKYELQDYLRVAKGAAHEFGIHISERVMFIEQMAMDVSMMIRILDNADDEDRNYHGISEAGIVNHMRKCLEVMHSKDQEWAKEKGALFVGKL